jgi:hypothetical protein
MSGVSSPSYALQLGSQRWTEQLVALRLELERAPRVDCLSLQLPAAAPLAAALGDGATLTLDSGEQREVVFTGVITSIVRSFDAIYVRALDAGGTLARYRPATTYEQLKVSTLISSLAADAGVDVGTLDAGPDLPFYVADPSRTAWEHVARLAALGGALARVSSDNQVQSIVVDATAAELALRYGRELLSLDWNQQLSAADSWTVAGEAGAGDASAPEALRPTNDFFAGNRPDGPTLGKRWSFEPALRTVKAAATASAAIVRAARAASEAGTLRMTLQPKLRCGTVIELQDLPAGLPAGPLWIGSVQHVLGVNGALTTARVYQGGDSFDPAALLGSLASSLGGLL